MREVLFAAVVAGALSCATRAHSDAEVAPTDVAARPPAVAASAQVEAVAPSSAPASTLVLKNARLVDGTGAAAKASVDVLVEGDRIASIGSALAVPEGARVIDVGGRTLLPGFIDTHVHMTFMPAPSHEAGVTRAVKWHETDQALHGVAHAWATLRAGFTTVRNVGGSFADRALRDAIAQGYVPGPRMLVANHSIGITGGHCDDTNGMHPDIAPARSSWQGGTADGVDEVRKAVRYQVKHGADVIKLCATGGVMSQGDGVGNSQMTLDELRAAVDEAHRADRRVAAHAHGNAGIRDAVTAGVDSIEHGSILDGDTVALMRKRGTFLVPTLYVGAVVERRANAGTLSPESAAKAKSIAPRMRESFALAYKGNVKIALGSDAGVFDHGENGREFTQMIEHGMTPMDAIVAGTGRAAELLGLTDVGLVREGFRADLVVVDGDPLKTPKLLEAPALVIKSGVVHVEPTWVSRTTPAG
jgi:imidazolonepropionase-like amidohydrolase